MKNLILKYGLYSGALSVAIMAATTLWFQQTGQFGGGEVLGYASMILSMLFVYIGARAFRDQQRNGSITFGEAFKVAGLIALVSCLCYVIGWMFMYEFIMPDFLDQYIAFYLEKLKTDGKTEAEIQKAMTDMAQYKTWYKNPLYRMGLTFLEPLPVALLVSLVSAALLRRKA